MARTFATSCASLPPEGAVLAWGGPALRTMAPTLVASRTALPPEGALRLRPGKAGSAAPAGEEGAPTLASSCAALPSEGAECRGSEPADAGLDGMKSDCVSQPCGLHGLRLRPGKAGSAAPAGEEGAPTLVASCPPLPAKGAGLAWNGPAMRPMAFH